MNQVVEKNMLYIVNSTNTSYSGKLMKVIFLHKDFLVLPKIKVLVIPYIILRYKHLR